MLGDVFPFLFMILSVILTDNCLIGVKMSTLIAPMEAIWNARRKIKTEQPFLTFIENTGPTKFNLTLKANVSECNKLPIHSNSEA